MDLKVMPKLSKGHKFILCIIDEVMNNLIMIPVYQSKAEEIGEALIEHIMHKILCSRLYNNGPGQHIYVISYELFI